MDDSGTGSPESDPVAVGYTFEKIVYLAVRLVGGRQIGRSTPVCLDQVVAVDGCRYGRTVASGIHELQQGHLCRCVLHGYAVGTEIDVIGTPNECFGIRRVVKMGIQNLFGERKRCPFNFPCTIDLRCERFIYVPDHFNVKCHICCVL